MKKSGIYVITNIIIDGKKYVGSSVNVLERLKKHKRDLNNNKHDNSKLQNAWNKYGSINFKFEVLEECSVENLLVREQYYLDNWNLVEIGYNICPTAGNSLGYNHTNEAILKMKECKKGEKNPMFGKPQSDEHKRKIAEAQIGEKCHMFGKKLSEETKRKKSEAMTGKTQSEETKRKRSESLKLYWQKKKKGIL